MIRRKIQHSWLEKWILKHVIQNMLFMWISNPTFMIGKMNFETCYSKHVIHVNLMWLTCDVCFTFVMSRVTLKMIIVISLQNVSTFCNKKAESFYSVKYELSNITSIVPSNNLFSLWVSRWVFLNNQHQIMSITLVQ